MKFDIPEQKKLVHEVVIPIRWGDMDAMGHVNNTTYFRYLETCRIDWMHAAGASPRSGWIFPSKKPLHCRIGYAPCCREAATRQAGIAYLEKCPEAIRLSTSISAVAQSSSGLPGAKPRRCAT